MEEKISVIVPVYNMEKYLSRCMEPLLHQTYENLEIILVDDGSKDHSPKLCDDYARKDARVRVIHKENGGSSSARNAGIEAATGEYIGFLDSDDYPDTDMYETLYRVAKEKQADVVQTMSKDFDEEGNLVKDAYKSGGAVNFLSREEMFRLLMLHVGDSSFCTKLVKASLMKKLRFPEKKLNEDFKLVLDLLNYVDGVYSIEESKYNIVLRGESNSRNRFSEVFYNSIVENSDTAYEMMKKQFPSLVEETTRFYYIQRMYYLLHIPVELMTKENIMYRKVIEEVKRGRRQIRKNAYLSKKEKRNLLIVSYLPKASKRLHGLIMKLKKAA